ncbi:MAG: hypothetical protein ACTHL8_24370 [Burkholderiaceae bacterium]
MKLIGTGLALSLSAIGVATSAQSMAPTAASTPSQQITPESELQDFLKRTFLGPEDTATYQNNIQTLVGQYVIMVNGKPQIQGDTELDDPSSSVVVSLKSGQTIHFQREEKTDGSFNWLQIFGVNASTDKLFDLVVQDASSVSNSKAKASSCAKNRPSQISEKTQYWCIASATLSTVSFTQYVKGKVDGNGAIGVVKAGATYALDQSQSTTPVRISYTVFGPFVGNQAVTSQSSLTANKHGHPLPIDLVVQPTVPQEFEGLMTVAGKPLHLRKPRNH